MTTIEAQNKALALKPNYSEASFSLATLFYRTRKFEMAMPLFRKDNSSMSQTLSLKSLHELDEKPSFIKQLNYLIARGENNAVIGSYISRSQLKYGVNIKNPFCSEPLKYARTSDLRPM